MAGESWGFFGFVLYWVTFEYVHLNWDVSWPWLTLGNGFASFPEWVQWYEYTGVFGGTLWILLGNIAFYFVFLRDGALWQGIIRWRSLVYTGLWVVLPILGSYIIYLNYEEKGPEVEVVAVQPNINPYTEKFVGGENFIPYAEQVDRFAALSEQKITPQTQFVLWPESAFDGAYWESDFANTDVYQRIMAFKDQYPDLSLVTGMTSLIQYPRASDVTPTARYSENIGSYDVFNTAFLCARPRLLLSSIINRGWYRAWRSCLIHKCLAFFLPLFLTWGAPPGALGDKPSAPCSTMPTRWEPLRLSATSLFTATTSPNLCATGPG